MMSFSGAGLRLRRSRTPPISVSLLQPIHLGSDFSMRNWTTNQPISRSRIFAFWEFEDRATWSSKNRDSRLKKSDRSKPQQKIWFSSMKKIGFPLMKKIGIRLWRNVGLLLGEGERRKRKGKERKRNSLVLRTRGRHVSDAGPTKMHVFTLLPPLLIFQKLKTTESCFQFPWLKLNCLRIELGNSSKQSKSMWGPQNLEIEWWKLSIGWWKHLNQTSP